MKKLFLISSGVLLFAKLFLIASSVVLFTGCNQTSNDTAVTTTTTIAVAGNNLTVSDNDSSYTEGTAACSLTETSANAIINIQSTLYSAFPVSLSFTATGPAGGVGNYHYTPIDSTAWSFPFYFSESFVGGESYKIDSVLVDVLHISADTVVGTYRLWLSNTSKSQSVTGTFDCDAATIN